MARCKIYNNLIENPVRPLQSLARTSFFADYIGPHGLLPGCTFLWLAAKKIGSMNLNA
jgi:hypothetical protein